MQKDVMEFDAAFFNVEKTIPQTNERCHLKGRAEGDNSKDC